MSELKMTTEKAAAILKKHRGCVVMQPTCKRKCDTCALYTEHQELLGAIDEAIISLRDSGRTGFGAYISGLTD